MGVRQAKQFDDWKEREIDGLRKAIGLAEAGADIIGVSATIELQGSEIEKAVVQAGQKFKAYQADFSDRPSLMSFIQKVKSDFP